MAQFVKRRTINPTPSVLALVNPKKRGKKMAIRKRRRGGKRRTTRVRARARTANPINPVRRRRRRVSRRRTHTVHARARRRNPINPTRRRRVHHRRRHRNPLAGASSEIINFTVAGLSLGMAQPFIQRFAGGLLPFGQYNAPILSAGTGWLLSKAFSMFSFTRRFAHPVLIFGFATAAMQVLQPIVRGALGGAPANPMMSGWGGSQYSGWNNRPMRGIGVTHGMPPVITAPPLPPQSQANARGMSGMAMRPGNYGF
jgi:hypothetical protein